MRIDAYITPTGFLFFGYLALRAGLVDFNMSQKAKKWPHVKGQLIAVEIKKQVNRSRDKKNRYMYGVIVKYEYTINGKKYISNRLTFSDLMRSNWKKVNKRAEALIDLDGVDVFYDPSDPKESVIDPRLAPRAVLTLCIGSTFTLFALGCIWLMSKK